MRYDQQAEVLARHLEILPFRERLAAVAPGALDSDLERQILDQAAQFAEAELETIAAQLDRDGAQLVDGRVRLSEEHRNGWRAFAAMGWLSMATAEPLGQGLSLPLLSACEELFNRASAPFCMVATSTRTASVILRHSAPPTMADAWIPHLLSGEWVATICISEPDAGSDVGRIRTRAVPDGDVWIVDGEKCWISYGDHDLALRIGHLALARTSDAPGVRGLSLFLIPSKRDDGSDNGVRVRRIDEKLGLHCSPTCQIGFESSQAVLIGAEGRGLQTLFPMMLLMRLNCGPQGTGVASAALAVALGYAQDRKQGGPAGAPPVPLKTHADIQRQLLSMSAKVETTRALYLATASALDLAQRVPDPDEAGRWSELAQFLLPLVKDGSAWAAFDASNAAIQVLGGAGYTAEWPVERYLRDARVFPIFEGTSGIQAIDLLHRRVWRDKRKGLSTFLELVGAEAAEAPELASAAAALRGAAETLASLEATPREGEACAVAFLELCKAVAHGWVAARILRLAGDDPTGKRMASGARFFLSELAPRARALADLSTAGAAGLAGFPDLIAG